METNLVLNYKTCHFKVEQGIFLKLVASFRGFKVDKAKIDIILSLSYPASVWEVRSFFLQVGFYRNLSKTFQKQHCLYANLWQGMQISCLVKNYFLSFTFKALLCY